jgi:hypothetical protein
MRLDIKTNTAKTDPTRPIMLSYFGVANFCETEIDRLKKLAPRRRRSNQATPRYASCRCFAVESISAASLRPSVRVIAYHYH